VTQQPHALLASIGGKQLVTPAVGTPLGHELADGAYSNRPLSYATGRSGTSSNADTAPGAGPQTQTTPPVGGSSDGSQSNAPATSATTSPAPRDGLAALADNGSVPFDCGLPAGCGVGSNTSYVARQPSLTGVSVPVARDSQGASPPND